MKRALLVIAIAAVSSVMTVAIVSAQAKPEKGVIVGTVIELSTYAMKGVGEEHVAAHHERIEQGFPVGILEEDTGKVWVCVWRDTAPASHLETANANMLEFAGKMAVVQGLKYEADGVNVIRVGVASEY